jgi:serine phosphatase RsbU (regulator of sigma subunit)
MTATAPARVLVCADQTTASQELRRVLARGGWEADAHAPGAADPDGLHAFGLVVVDSGGDAAAALALCRRLRDRLADGFTPLLYVAAAGGPADRLAGYAAGADACLPRPFAPEELLAQARALGRIKEIHDRLNEKTAEARRVHQRLQLTYRQIDEELELARRVQSGLLPQALPEAPGCRFAVHYRLCGQVGGDFYDAFRLDEHHVGFYVADAMGHGVAASLLTVFVKKGIRAKEVFGREYRLTPPGEVLGRLNRDLIDQRLTDHPFITAAYGLFNHRDGVLSVARAGHPYPLHVPREGAVQMWRQEGLLLGVLEAAFPDRQYHLRPGDKVLLYTDGVDAARVEGREPGAPSLLACAERRRGLPVEEFVPQLARDLFGGAEQPDDLTLLGLEMCP